MKIWIDLEPFWERLQAVAAQRDAQKRNFKSAKYLNKDSNFIGLCGEMALGIFRGREPDLSLRIDGDGGTDFGTVDVKTVPDILEPSLKRFAKETKWAEWYALVALDLKKKRAWLVGYTSGENLRNAPIREFGHGPTHTLHWTKLKPFLPSHRRATNR
jgi:hypothetical protein